MYLISKWAAISGSGITTWVYFAFSAMAQSPLPGVTIPSTTPNAVEQTISKPTQLPLPLSSETPASPPQLELQAPSNQEPSGVTAPLSAPFFIKQVEV